MLSVTICVFSQESIDNGLPGWNMLKSIKYVCLCDGNSSFFIYKHHKEDVRLQDISIIFHYFVNHQEV
jgi:hypothetical protein